MAHGTGGNELFGAAKRGGREDDGSCFQGLPDVIDAYRRQHGANTGFTGPLGEGECENSIPANDERVAICATATTPADPVTEEEGADVGVVDSCGAPVVRRKPGLPLGSRNRARNESSGNVAAGCSAAGQIDRAGNGESSARRDKRFK